MILTLYIIGALVMCVILGYAFAGIPKKEFNVFSVYGVFIIFWMMALWPLFLVWVLIDVFGSSDDDAGRSL